MRAQLILLILLVLISFQTASGNVLRLICTDSRGDPVGDAIVYIDCRHNFFFTDENGVALIWVDEPHSECIVTVDRPELVGKDALVEIDPSRDTIDVEMILYRWDDPELIVPGDPQSRFKRVQFCNRDAESSYEQFATAEGSVLLLTLPGRQIGSESEACYVSLSEDEKIITDFYQGYQLETAVRIVFSARSVDGSRKVRFFSLYYGCQSTPGSYPVIERDLSSEFAEYEIDITRWNRSGVQSIWGCSAANDESATIEIRDLRILHQRPSDVIGSR
jgi:hypothetical protein